MKDSDTLLTRFIIRKVARSLTGKIEDMKKLLTLATSGRVELNSAAQWFMKSLSKSMDEGGLLSSVFLRVGKELSGAYKKKLVRNLIINQFIAGSKTRALHQNEREWIPNFIVVSPTMKCNLACTGCYSGLYRKNDELTMEELDDLFGQCRSLGTYFIVISGGEPFVKKEELSALFKKYGDMFFLVYTNGTMIDRSFARKLARLGNVAPAISVEGWEKETDQRRGSGVWNRAMAAMDNLREAGVLFGISVTMTRHNADIITEDRFVEYFMTKGAIFGWYFMFMPVGKDPILDLVPTPEQRVTNGRRIEALRSKYPMFLADFWNDGPAVGGCLAGGRQYLHILNNGQVEPCVFAHFSCDNIREKPLIECVNSPFFRGIRGNFPYNATGNLKRPCMIIDNPEVLRSLVEKHVVPSGHTHSEDIVSSPDVREFIDRYAERMAELTEPAWREMIEDPACRWHLRGDDYRSLFKFASPDCVWKREAAGVTGGKYRSAS